MAKQLAKSVNDKKRLGHDREQGPYASACGRCDEDGHEGLHQTPKGDGYGCGGNDTPDVQGLRSVKPYGKR